MLWYDMTGGQSSGSGDRAGRGSDGSGIGDGLILVVDDAPLNRDMMSVMLKQLGYRHHAVTNGAEAVAFAAANPCALILMDLQMPIMDGDAAARAIKALPGDAGRVPIICMSGNLSLIDQAGLQASGMVATLEKPFRMAELAQSIRTHARSAETAVP